MLSLLKLVVVVEDSISFRYCSCWGVCSSYHSWLLLLFVVRLNTICLYCLLYRYLQSLCLINDFIYAYVNIYCLYTINVSSSLFMIWPTSTSTPISMPIPIPTSTSTTTSSSPSLSFRSSFLSSMTVVSFSFSFIIYISMSITFFFTFFFFIIF